MKLKDYAKIIQAAAEKYGERDVVFYDQVTDMTHEAMTPRAITDTDGREVILIS